jgi:methionyl-tRNA formyltransferase
MRIEFLTQDDPIYILPLFEEFFRHYAAEWEITRVSCCPTMGKRPRAQLLKELTELYGVSGMARLLARSAAARCFGLLPFGRTARTFFSLSQLCAAYKVGCHRIGDPNSEEFVSGLIERRPDLIVSVACPYILKRRLLGLPPMGCINIHHAPLPRYKGMMPTFWQLYHGEQTVGLTIHYMAEKVDEGDAILQEKLEVASGETLHQLIQRSKRHAAHCLARALRQLRSRTVTTISLNHSESSYFTFPTLQEIEEFRRRGLRAI